MVKKFPSGEKFYLADQLIRASRSVIANVAGGYGGYHYQENIQFCRQASGSLCEIVDNLAVALDEGYITAGSSKTLREEVFPIIKKLRGYIRYLWKGKNGG